MGTRKKSCAHKKEAAARAAASCENVFCDSSEIPDGVDGRAIDADFVMAVRLHGALENALATLPQEQADALRTKYYEERPADARACQKGLRALRHPNISKELKDFL